MSEPSKIRWLNIVGVVAAAAALCALPLDAIRSGGNTFRMLGGGISLMLFGMIAASIAAIVSRRRGSDDPTKTGVHVGIITVFAVALMAGFGHSYG